MMVVVSVAVVVAGKLPSVVEIEVVASTSAGVVELPRIAVAAVAAMETTAERQAPES